MILGSRMGLHHLVWHGRTGPTKTMPHMARIKPGRWVFKNVFLRTFHIDDRHVRNPHVLKYRNGYMDTLIFHDLFGPDASCKCLKLQKGASGNGDAMYQKHIWACLCQGSVSREVCKSRSESRTVAEQMLKAGINSSTH